ncbi:MAG: hypothetical protein CMJ81_08575 [Planctomycetaceae bacterium]|nr:hypothetical protein [Planctomycetaceae bacterium]
MHPTIQSYFFTFAVIWPALIAAQSTTAKQPIFVFNSDGGAAAIANVAGEMTREVVCRELDELEGTAVTDFFWCPIVGGNVFIYPTEVGERMGDNIRDWGQVHPYYREQGQALAANLRQLTEQGDDPIKMLAARAKELGIRFWLTCRMNEIHEDDERFMALRSLFKQEHPELLHGKNYHPEAVYAPKKGYSYAWDYGQIQVREHFLALFREWLQYGIDGIELDFCRSPCLFPPGQEREGMRLLTDFMTKLRVAAHARSEDRGHQIKLAIRVPPSLERCRAAGIDVRTWIDGGLVDVVTPMDRGYFDPEPALPDFVAIAKPKGVVVLGGIEPKVRGYLQSNRQTFAAVANFLHRGADGIYLFNYDCHRQLASSSKFGGVLQHYTPGEQRFLRHALQPEIVRNQDKQYVISQATNQRLAEEGGDRPLRCRLPVGELRTFFMTVGDDLQKAARENRLRSVQLVIKLQECAVKADELNLRINAQAISLAQSHRKTQRDLVVITLAAPPMHRGMNTIKLGLNPTSDERGLIHSIDLNVDYATRDD